MNQLGHIWSNLLGDWFESLKYQLILTVPITVLFWYIYSKGLYPSDAKTLQDRGWHQGFFLTHLGLVPYLFFYFFVMGPVQELIFRKLAITQGVKWLGDSNFWIVNMVQASAFASLRGVYPYPLGIILIFFIMGVIYGHDYKNNHSMVILSVFHFMIVMMAITVNLI
jgi:hypothetical protein